MAGLSALPFGAKALLGGLAVAAAATTAVIVSNSGSAPDQPGPQVVEKVGADTPSLPVGGKTQEERRRFKIIDWKIKKVFDDVADVRQAQPKDEADEMNRTLTGATPEGVEPTKQMFAKHRFEHIEKIAKAKLLTKETMDMMARHRRELTNQALVVAMAEFDKEGKFTCGALDSGNKASGIASDVDQTIFLIPKDPKAKLDSAQINAFIKVFDAKFEAITGKPPAWYGIECMNGADFYPDWSTELLVSAFMSEAERVFLEKRANPEAYQSEGQLKSQAEGRGYDSLQSQIKKLHALSEARKALESAKNGEGTAAEKLAEQQKIMAALVAKTMKNASPDDFKTGNEAEIAAALAKIETDISFNSPWTEVSRGPDGKVRVTQVESPLGKVLPNKPEFSKRFAFDGAWDNWLMYTAHPHNRTKYLIRSVAEGSGVLFGVVEIMNGTVSGKSLAPFEYDSIYGTGDTERLHTFVNETYKHLPEDVRRKYRKSMDIAAKVRLRHKGTPPFKSMDDRTIFLEYVTEFKVSPEEAKLYSPEALQTLILERAQRAWEHDSREVMIENLLITADSAADILRGRLTSQERTRLETDPRLRVGGFERLTAAVLKQFEHAFIDLMSREHAQALLLPEDSPRRKELEKTRQRDILDRILERFAGDAELSARLKDIALSAAEKRVALDSAIAKDLAFHKRFYRSMKVALAGAPEAIKARVQDEYSRWKAGEKGYTVKDASIRLTKEIGDRVEGRWLDFYHGLGFELNTYESDGKAPSAELGKWDRKQAMVNMASAGNFDSALEVWRAYLEGGDAKAAAKAAFIEAVSNLPYVSEGMAIFDAGNTGNYQGIVQLGAAYYVPGAGQAYLVANIAKNVVWIGGYYVFQPLKDDIAEKTYQGFLDKKAGIISTGVKETQISVRPSLLSNVKNLRVIPYVEKDEKGNPIKDKEGKEQINYAFAEYSFDEAVELGWLESEGNVTLRQDYEWLKSKGILGGGADYEKQLKLAQDGDRNPRMNFDARRASLYFQYEKRAAAALKPQNIELRHADDAYPTVRAMFGRSLHEWLNGTGEFANVVDGEVNLLLEGKIEQVKDAIIDRMSRDFFWSGELVRHGKYSIENMIKGNIEKARDERMKQGSYQMVLSEIDGARKAMDQDAVAALSELVRERVLEYQIPEPRVKLRPRVVTVKNEKNEEVDTVECIASVLADAVQFPRTASGDFLYHAAWETFKKAEDHVLRVTFTAKDSRGQTIAKPIVREIGTVHQIESGPLRIVGKRLGETSGLIVTSDALAKLDPKNPDAGLEFRIYRSQSPSGPFVLSEVAGGVAFKEDPLPMAKGNGVGWLSPNQFIIGDNLPIDPQPPAKPFYYQVGMVPVVFDGGIKPMGEEVRSATSQLGTGIINVAGLDLSANEMIQTSSYDVALGLSDQAFDVQGAHIIVTAGDFVGHFFSPRREGKQVYGGGASWNAAPTRVWAPHKPGGQAMTIKGEGGGLSASRNLKLIEHPEHAEAFRRQFEQALAGVAASRQVERSNNEILDAEHKKQQARTAEDRAKFPPKDDAARASVDIDDARVKFDTLFYRTLGPKRRYAELDAQEARVRGDWKKVKQGYEQALQVWEQMYLAQKAWYDEREALMQKYLQFEKNATSRAERVVGLEKEMKSWRHSNEEWINQQRFDTARAIADGAYFGGDAAAYQKAMEMLIQCLERAKTEKLNFSSNGATRGGLRMNMAEGLVLLTGNQGAAASLYTEGWNMLLADAFDDQQRANMKERWETQPRPAWWPGGAP